MVSKMLTKVLRHQAPNLGIQIRPDGYCRLADLLNLRRFKRIGCGADEVIAVVRTSDKRRFEAMEEDGDTYIRAVQGHSIALVEDELILRRLNPEDALPVHCVHGTYWRNYESIKMHGLLAGGLQGQGRRTHVHFSGVAPGDRRGISGILRHREVAIWIDLQKAVRDGVPFWVSSNQVILSPGIRGVVDCRYFVWAQDLVTWANVPLRPAAGGNREAIGRHEAPGDNEPAPEPA